MVIVAVEFIWFSESVTSQEIEEMKTTAVNNRTTLYGKENELTLAK